MYASKGTFVLRKNGYRDGLEEILFGEDFVVHLMDGGIPISALVPTRTGDYHVEENEGQVSTCCTNSWRASSIRARITTAQK